MSPEDAVNDYFKKLNKKLSKPPKNPWPEAKAMTHKDGYVYKNFDSQIHVAKPDWPTKVYLFSKPIAAIFRLMEDAGELTPCESALVDAGMAFDRAIEGLVAAQDASR